MMAEAVSVNYNSCSMTCRYSLVNQKNNILKTKVVSYTLNMTHKPIKNSNLQQDLHMDSCSSTFYWLWSS